MAKSVCIRSMLGRLLDTGIKRAAGGRCISEFRTGPGRDEAHRREADLLNPLGLDNSFVVAIRANDPQEGRAKSRTLKRGGCGQGCGWILGATAEFQQLDDGMPKLTDYKLPMKAAPRRYG